MDENIISVNGTDINIKTCPIKVLKQMLASGLNGNRYKLVMQTYIIRKME